MLITCILLALDAIFLYGQLMCGLITVNSQYEGYVTPSL